MIENLEAQTNFEIVIKIKDLITKALDAEEALFDNLALAHVKIDKYKELLTPDICDSFSAIKDKLTGDFVKDTSELRDIYGLLKTVGDRYFAVAYPNEATIEDWPESESVD